MSDRNFFLHCRDTNHCTSGGDNLFTRALGRKFYTQNFQSVSAHVLGDFFNLGHRICSTFCQVPHLQHQYFLPAGLTSPVCLLHLRKQLVLLIVKKFDGFTKFFNICCQFIELQINFVCFSPYNLLYLIQSGHIRGTQRRFPPTYIENTFQAIQSTFRTLEMHSTRCYKICICSVILGQLESVRN